jgi:hypothetical protein
MALPEERTLPSAPNWYIAQVCTLCRPAVATRAGRNHCAAGYRCWARRRPGLRQQERRAATGGDRLPSAAIRDVPFGDAALVRAVRWREPHSAHPDEPPESDRAVDWRVLHSRHRFPRIQNTVHRLAALSSRICCLSYRTGTGTACHTNRVSAFVISRNVETPFLVCVAVVCAGASTA